MLSNRFRARALATLAVTALAGLGTASSASASNVYEVDSTADAALANSASTECVATNTECTLRAAVQAADNYEEKSTIILPAGDYTLTRPSTNSTSAGNGDLDVIAGTELTIEGAGASSTIINANHIDRAFTVHGGNSLTIKGVTVRNGSGGAADSTAPNKGGAFYNDGSLRIEASTLSDNSSSGEGGVVYADTGATTTAIIGSNVQSNAAGGEGGVVFASAGAVTLSEDFIAHDTANSYGGVVAAEEGGSTDPIEINDSDLWFDVADGYGGAIYEYRAGPLLVSESELDKNTSGDEEGGGAIYAEESGEVTIEGSTFYGNSAPREEGGAIDTDHANLSVSKSGFYDNTAGYGGALYLHATSAEAPQSISESTFAENGAEYSEGGAIYIDTGNLYVDGSTFTDNNASSEGGALYYGDEDGMSLTNDTFDGNQAGGEGGALDLAYAPTEGQVNLLNDTITDNTSHQGGGIYEPRNADNIENTIVANNEGGDCDGLAGPSDNAEEADAGGNIDSDATCFGEAPHDLNNVDPLLGALLSNGGPTQTNALETGSPAINDGVTAPLECPDADQRGVARTGGCDSGAYQAEPADVSVAISGPSKSKSIGEPVTYGLEVEDHGPAPATGITVTDTLPAGTTYYSSEVGHGAGACFQETETTVTCSISGYLADGAKLEIAIVAIPTEAGNLKDTAAVTANEEDPVTANNTASAEATVVSNERVERVETTKTVEVTKTVDVPTGVSSSTPPQCKSARSETIGWKVPGGVSLRRIVVTRNGKTYKTLAGSARKVTVSMVGLPKGAVPVKITGYTASGRRYVMTRTFHLCVPAKEGGPSSDYLTKG
jgi:uncharacterized repeat protein (TIGR01451 family)